VNYNVAAAAAAAHRTEVSFASLLSGGFTYMAVINPPERKLPKRTSVHQLGDMSTTAKNL
jgi:hypothetical protein